MMLFVNYNSKNMFIMDWSAEINIIICFLDNKSKEINYKLQNTIKREVISYLQEKCYVMLFTYRIFIFAKNLKLIIIFVIYKIKSVCQQSYSLCEKNNLWMMNVDYILIFLMMFSFYLTTVIFSCSWWIATFWKKKFHLLSQTR